MCYFVYVSTRRLEGLGSRVEGVFRVWGLGPMVLVCLGGLPPPGWLGGKVNGFVPENWVVELRTVGKTILGFRVYRRCSLTRERNPP